MCFHFINIFQIIFIISAFQLLHFFLLLFSPFLNFHVYSLMVQKYTCNFYCFILALKCTTYCSSHSLQIILKINHICVSYPNKTRTLTQFNCSLNPLNANYISSITRVFYSDLNLLTYYHLYSHSKYLGLTLFYYFICILLHHTFLPPPLFFRGSFPSFCNRSFSNFSVMVCKKLF